MIAVFTVFRIRRLISRTMRCEFSVAFFKVKTHHDFDFLSSLGNRPCISPRKAKNLRSWRCPWESWGCLKSSHIRLPTNRRMQEWNRQHQIHWKSLPLVRTGRRAFLTDWKKTSSDQSKTNPFTNFFSRNQERAVAGATKVEFRNQVENWVSVSERKCLPKKDRFKNNHLLFWNNGRIVQTEIVFVYI